MRMWTRKSRGRRGRKRRKKERKNEWKTVWKTVVGNGKGGLKGKHFGLDGWNISVFSEMLEPHIVLRLTFVSKCTLFFKYPCFT